MDFWNEMIKDNEQANNSNQNSVQTTADKPIVKGYTIDGETSKDLDDGIFLSKSGDDFLLAVSISDVSSVVTSESNLFFKSLEKAETIYLANSNIPMLPRRLSEDELSLVPNCLRPVITFEMLITPEGDVSNFEMKENTFLNIRRLNYDEFDNIESNNPDDPDYELFQDMGKLAYMLLDKRRQNGALALYDLKNGVYTNEEGNILPLPKGSTHLSHIVIQEFMILANKTIAWFFAENNVPLLFRNHTAKMNAPTRNEILEQYNTAILNPQYMEALSGRSSLWFNRADYSPYLTGHYGLNLPAYAHVTSPIRRVVDLINHMLIKSYIHQAKLPFTFNKLSFLSKDINRIITEHKDEKSQKLKDASKRIATEKLEKSNQIQLAKMEQSVFEKVLKAASASDEIPENLVSALQTKFEFKQVDLNMLYIIFFQTPKTSPQWLAMRNEAMKSVHERKEDGLQLLNLLKQNNRLENLNILTNQTDNIFSAKTSGSFDNQDYDTPDYSEGVRKKEAVYNSVIRFLCLILEIPEPEKNYSPLDSETDSTDNQSADTDMFFIDKELSSKGRKDILEDKSVEEPLDLRDYQNLLSQNIQTPTTFEDNYIGQLLEITNQNKKWSAPIYDFTLKGMTNSPVIICVGKLITPDAIIEEQAVSKTKKSAKQEVSKKIIDKIKELKLLETTELTFDDSEIENNVGKLFEMCATMKIDEPLFEYKQVGSQHRPTFECILTIHWNHQDYVFTGTGETKKIAKHVTSGICISEIKRLKSEKESRFTVKNQPFMELLG